MILLFKSLNLRVYFFLMDWRVSILFGVMIIDGGDLVFYCVHAFEFIGRNLEKVVVFTYDFLDMVRFFRVQMIKSQKIFYLRCSGWPKRTLRA